MHVRPTMSILLLAIAFSSFSQNLTADERMVRKIKEQDWTNAHANQDTELLTKILADEFFMIDADGNNFGKKQEIEYVRDNKPKYDTFNYSVGRLLIFDNTTAILNGLGILTGEDDHGPYTTTYQSSDVMIKRNGQWQTVSTHISGLRKDYAGG